MDPPRPSQRPGVRPPPLGLTGQPSDVSWGLRDVLIAIVAGYLGAAVVASVCASLGGWTTAAETPGWALFAAQIPLWAAMVGVPVWATRTRGSGPGPDLHLAFRWLDVPLGVAAGLVTQLGLVRLLYWPLGRWISSDRLEAPARDLADRFGGAWGAVLLVVMVCIAAPVAEEVLYRGLLLRSLQRRVGTTWAVVVSSLVFGAMHLQFVQFPGLALFGLVAALLVVRTGRLGTSILAHVAFNAVTVVSLLQR